MKRFHVPEQFNHLTVNGREYDRGEDGTIEVHSHEDHAALRTLGCRSEDDPAPIGQRVEPSEPPPLPEGFVDPEVVRGLIEENEDQKVAIDTLNKRLEVAATQFTDLNDANAKLTEELSSATKLEGELRSRIQELEGQLADATEKTPEERLQEVADEHAIVEEKTTEEAPPARRGR